MPMLRPTNRNTMPWRAVSSARRTYWRLVPREDKEGTAHGACVQRLCGDGHLQEFYETTKLQRPDRNRG